MIYDNYATWAGVAIRLADGSIVAYEIGGSPQVTLRMTHEFDRASFLFGLMQNLPPHNMTTEIDIRIRGVVGHGQWRAGADEARRHEPAGAIDEGPRAIERGADGDLH